MAPHQKAVVRGRHYDAQLVTATYLRPRSSADEELACDHESPPPGPASTPVRSDARCCGADGLRPAAPPWDAVAQTPVSHHLFSRLPFVSTATLGVSCFLPLRSLTPIPAPHLAHRRYKLCAVASAQLDKDGFPQMKSENLESRNLDFSPFQPLSLSDLTCKPLCCWQQLAFIAERLRTRIRLSPYAFVKIK